MMIVDAIRSATTPHAVKFLVTAYIESLRHFERSCGVPATMLDLPLGDRNDLARRLNVLRRHTLVPFEAIIAISELAAVLDCAIERLPAVSEAAPVAVMPPARSDSLRHLRSMPAAVPA